MAENLYKVIETTIPANKNNQTFFHDEINGLCAFAEGEPYRITIDDVTYDAVGKIFSGTVFYIGNRRLVHSTGDDTGESFYFEVDISWPDDLFAEVVVQQKTTPQNVSVYWVEKVSDEPDEGETSSGKRYLLHQMFSPIFAHALTGELFPFG